LLVDDGRKKAFIRRKTRGEQSGVFGSQKAGDFFLKLAMNRLRAAKKPHRRDTVAVITYPSDGGLFDPGIGSQPEIVVRCQHHRIFAGYTHDGTLLRLDDCFLFECLCPLEAAELPPNGFVQIHDFSVTLTLFKTTKHYLENADKNVNEKADDPISSLSRRHGGIGTC